MQPDWSMNPLSYIGFKAALWAACPNILLISLTWRLCGSFFVRTKIWSSPVKTWLWTLCCTQSTAMCFDEWKCGLTCDLKCSRQLPAHYRAWSSAILIASDFLPIAESTSNLIGFPSGALNEVCVVGGTTSLIGGVVSPLRILDTVGFRLSAESCKLHWGVLIGFDVHL